MTYAYIEVYKTVAGVAGGCRETEAVESAEVKAKLLILLEKVRSWVSYQERPEDRVMSSTHSTRCTMGGRMYDLMGLSVVCSSVAICSSQELVCVRECLCLLYKVYYKRHFMSLSDQSSNLGVCAHLHQLPPVCQILFYAWLGLRFSERSRMRPAGPPFSSSGKQPFLCSVGQWPLNPQLVPEASLLTKASEGGLGSCQ